MEIKSEINKIISIIIPVYNAENYLQECLDSIRKQSLTNLEIICIDDGSTDNSVSVIKNVMKKDFRIQLIEQTNQGAGIARNNGLKNATGKYVAFLDADDFFYDVDALWKMIEQCEEREVLVCGSFSKKIEKNVISDLNFWGENRNMLSLNTLKYDDYQVDYGYCSFIFNREFLEKNHISFPPYRRFQDPPFFVKALHAAGNFAMADTYLYCYRIPAMVSRYNTQKVIEMLQGITDNLQYARDHKLNILFQRTLDRLEYECCDCILHNLKSNDIIILTKLLYMNQIIQDYFENNTYIIRPLRKMQEKVVNTMDNYEEYLQSVLEKNDKIYIYGAGKYGKAFLKYLQQKGQDKKVECIVISSRPNGKEKVCNMPVVSVYDIEKNNLNCVKILIAVGGIAQKEIIKTLTDLGCNQFETLDSIFLSKL